MPRKPIKREYTEEQKDIVQDLGKAKALSSLADSEGGKLLIDTLKSELVSGIDSLVIAYKSASHSELIAICANLKARLDLLRSLTRAKEAKEVLENILADALKD
jgi:hypothetical protein